MRRKRPLVSGLVLATAVLAGGPGRADVVLLKGGGRVVGKVLSYADGQIRVRTTAGTLSIAASEATSITYGPTPEEEYAERLRVVDQRDTAALLDLADWCAAQGLSAQEQAALKAVLAVDQDHPEARRRLGFQRTAAGWVTVDEAMRAKGLVKHLGRWVTPAERDDLERRDLDRRLEQRWRTTVSAAARALENGNKAARSKALAELRAIQDPLVARPLAQVIGETANPQVRRTLVGILAGFAKPGPAFDRTLDALVDIALLDESAEVRADAVDVLVEAQDPRVPQEFVRALGQDSWTLKLRACFVLGELRAFEAVPDLIRNLTAIEGYQRRVSWAWRGGGLSHGTGTAYVESYRVHTAPGVAALEPIIGFTGSGTGLATTPQRVPAVERQPVRSYNSEAWRALVKISGKDFGYYEDQWRAWYDQERRNRARAGGN